MAVVIVDEKPDPKVVKQVVAGTSTGDPMNTDQAAARSDDDVDEIVWNDPPKRRVPNPLDADLREARRLLAAKDAEIASLTAKRQIVLEAWNADRDERERFAEQVKRMKLDNDALRDNCGHFQKSHAAIARGVKSALGLHHWPEFTGTFQGEVTRLVSDVVSERDKQAVELREMRRLLKRSERVMERVYGAEELREEIEAALARTAYLEPAGEAE